MFNEVYFTIVPKLPKSSNQSKPRIAIIGGTGGMGVLFAELFRKAGLEVLIGSRKVAGSYEKAISAADIVIVSVPIQAVPETILCIKPFLKKNQLIVDFSSVQSPHHPSFKKLQCSAISVHPLFGPTVKDFVGQIFVFSEQNKLTHKGVSFLKNFFRNLGGTIVDMTPKSHDSSMALIQALIHVTHITTSAVIEDARSKAQSKVGGKVGDKATFLEKVSTPVYKLHRAVSGRIFSQPAELYANILMTNPEVLKVIDAEILALTKLRKVVADKDYKRFEQTFNKTKDLLGAENVKQCMQDTSKMLEIINKK